ncbi:MAG: NAD(P)-dependent oxidoreductase [Clostridia bacterium]|nr:NAD(P)-dependent oxidoreductase [Clostridia bacterium]
MKIGITGGTGFIGRCFVSENCGTHDLTILTLEGETPLHYGNERYIPSDFSKESIKKAFGDCDAIVHLAFARPPEGRKEALSDYSDSISLSERVFKAAEEEGIKNVVVMSSRSVYNSSMKMPLTEDDTAPYSIYGAAKLEVEKLGDPYNRRGMNIKFLRSAQVMGVGERRNLMTVYLESSVRKEPLKVYGEGISTKTYIYVKDVSKAIMCALNSPDVSGAFNIAMERPVSNAELAALYCKVFNNPDNVIFLRDKKEDGEFWQIDITKAKNLLGFRPEYDVESALTDMKRIIENN